MLGSNVAFGTLLAGGLEQVTYLFESIFVYKKRLILQNGSWFRMMVYMLLGT